MEFKTIGFFNIEFPSDPPFNKTKSGIGGGAGKSLLDLILNLNINKYKIKIFSISNLKNQNYTQYESPSSNLELYRYPTIGRKIFSKFYSFSHNIISPNFILDPLRYKLDLLHCQLGYPGADLSAINYKRRFHSPLVLSIRGIPKTNWSNPFQSMFMKCYLKTIYFKIVKMSDVIIVQSKDIISNFKMLSPHKNKIKIIPNGVDFELYSKYNRYDINNLDIEFDITSYDNIFLFVGSLSERKGIPTLIRAFKSFLKTNSNSLLIIIGAGILEKYIKNILNLNYFKNKIYYTGFIKNKEKLAKLYSIADLLILPSTHEGFPRVLLESMAAGTPCLASNIGPNIGALNGGKLGFIAKRGNYKDFFDKMKQFIEMDSYAKKLLIQKGLTYAKNHSWIKIAKKMENIYDNLLKN